MKLIEWINGKTKLNKTTFDEFQNNIKSAVVPTGGTTGQVLAKSSNIDNDVKWVNQTGGITVVDNLTSTSTTDALSANQGKILNDKITNANIYSTQEVNTGKKWIDGKDIYSRTYNGECNSNSSQTVASNLTYIDTMVKIEGTFQRKSDKLASPIGSSFSTSSGQSRGLWQGTKKEIIIEKDASIWNTNFDFIITVEYTKTI